MAKPPRPQQRCVRLLKGCPDCGGTAAAETRLPLSAHAGPVELDLDDLAGLAARLSLGELLALVELVPFKQFECRACGHGFRLANQTAKDMVVAMLGALQPVAPPPPTQARARAAARPRKPAPEWEPQSVDPEA